MDHCDLATSLCKDSLNNLLARHYLYTIKVLALGSYMYLYNRPIILQSIYTNNNMIACLSKKNAERILVIII